MTVVAVIVKVAAGQASGSVSVLSEGLQSGADVLISFAVLQTVRWSTRPPDESHPYGHGKAELIMGLLQTVVVLAASAWILVMAHHRLMHPAAIEIDWGIAAMAYAVIANTCVGAYLGRVAKRTKSVALRSEVLHLRSDSLAALGVLVGLVAVGITGWTPLDPIVAAVFVVISMVAAGASLRDVLHPLMDGALPEEDRTRIEKTLEGIPSVRGWHNVRGRSMGSHHVLELHVLLDDDLSFVRAHEIAEQVESALSEALDGALVSVHYEPFAAEMRHRREEHGEL
ncbi:MAG: Ferrous-iron efflux pump FieF [Fimbriimonadaceae bacterium]|nr:Ferrous-iron efflux pump FieF [Fimbriimonadaceae bacterium]